MWLCQLRPSHVHEKQSSLSSRYCFAKAIFGQYCCTRPEASLSSLHPRLSAGSVKAPVSLAAWRVICAVPPRRRCRKARRIISCPIPSARIGLTSTDTLHLCDVGVTWLWPQPLGHCSEQACGKRVLWTEAWQLSSFESLPQWAWWDATAKAIEDS